MINQGLWRHRRGRRRIRFWLIPVAFAVAACSDTSEPILTFWEADLVPLSTRAVSGRVVAVTQHGRTDIGISMENGEANTVYGWRVDSGNCDETGVIQGGAGLYPSLSPGASGAAEANTSLSVLFQSGRRFAARVFRSSDGGGEQVVACGNLQETG